MSEEKTNKKVIEEVAEVIEEANEPQVLEQTPEQIAQEEVAAKAKVTQEKITAILKEDNMKMIPFLNYTQTAVLPDVAIVPAMPEKEVEATPLETKEE